MRVFVVAIFLCSAFLSKINAQTYVGSTPANIDIRRFLEISPTDSIDFIRWKLEISAATYKFQCRYGISQPSESGFQNEKQVELNGAVTKSENTYHLKNKGLQLSILSINKNVLHLLSNSKNLLIGNGGYSFTLNNTEPSISSDFNLNSTLSTIKGPLVFEGRTPCQQLSAQLGLNKRDVCNKMKWYVLFYTDSITGKPSHFFKGGIGYRRETMERGTWQIITNKPGRIIYQLHFAGWSKPLNLLKGDDNILYFLDADDRILTGNEDFSYALNRRETHIQGRINDTSFRRTITTAYFN